MNHAHNKARYYNDNEESALGRWGRSTVQLVTQG
jgi:hypothetical protein